MPAYWILIMFGVAFVVAEMAIAKLHKSSIAIKRERTTHKEHRHLHRVQSWAGSDHRKRIAAHPLRAQLARAPRSSRPVAARAVHVWLS